MTERTNAQRAERAKKTLQFYKDLEDEGGPPDCEDDISDLLADLHHYMHAEPAARANIPYVVQCMAELMVTAVDNYEGEALQEKK